MFHFLVRADRWMNWATGGDPRATLSARWAGGRGRCRLCSLACSLLDVIDQGHCDRAHETYQALDKSLR